MKNASRISLTALTLALASTWLTACEQAPPAAPFKSVTDMRQFMEWVLDPVADELWASVGIIIDEKGETRIEPKTDAEWAQVRNNAAIIAEAANLLMLDSRAKDREGWMIAARGLIDQAERAIKAAEAKDADALFTANSDVFLACTECHKTYAFSTPAEAADAK